MTTTAAAAAAAAATTSVAQVRARPRVHPELPSIGTRTDGELASEPFPRRLPALLPLDVRALGEDLAPYYALLQSALPRLNEREALTLLLTYEKQLEPTSSLYASHLPDDDWLNEMHLAKLVPWLDVEDLRLNRPLNEWRIVKRLATDDKPIASSLVKAWQLHLAIVDAPVWKLMYVARMRDLYTLPENDFGDCHLAVPLRVKRTVSGTSPQTGRNDYLRQLAAINSMRDCYALTPSSEPADVAPNGLQRVVAMRMLNPTSWPAPHLELTISWSTSDRVSIDFPGESNSFWFSANASDAAQAALAELMVSVERDSVRQTFRVRHLPLNAPGAQFEFVEVGSEADLRFDAERDAPLIGGSELQLEELELRPHQLALRIANGAVSWAGAGASLLDMFSPMGGVLIFLRVRLLDAAWLPDVDRMPVQASKFRADRAFGEALATSNSQAFDFRTHTRLNKRHFGQHRAAALGRFPLDSMITVRLVFEFTASTSSFRLVTDDSGPHISQRSYLAHKLAPVGLVTALMLYGNEQMRSEDSPVFYSGGTNSFSPDNRACFETSGSTDAPFYDAMIALGPGAGAPPPESYDAIEFRADRALPPTAVHAVSPGSLFRHPGSPEAELPMPPPRGHPRIAELAMRGKKPVWFGLYVSKLHPNIERVMMPESELQVVVSDPSSLLASTGLTTMRVLIHCNYRQTPADKLIYQQPLEVNVALNMLNDGRCFPLPAISTPYGQWQ